MSPENGQINEKILKGTNISPENGEQNAGAVSALNSLNVLTNSILQKGDLSADKKQKPRLRPSTPYSDFPALQQVGEFKCNPQAAIMLLSL